MPHPLQHSNQGEWPEDWKKGEWVPAFKKDDKQIKTNY
jgi:hypothetical protein